MITGHVLEEKGVCPADEFLDYLDTADLSQYDFVAEQIGRAHV